MRVHAAVVLSLALVACNGPAAYPRSGEIAEPGAPHFEGNLQPASYEPQDVGYAGGGARSKAAFLPAMDAALRVGVFPRCELGGAMPYPFLWGRYLAEARCAVLEPSESDVAVAVGGAGGVVAGLGHDTAGWARATIDASARLGGVTAMLGAALSRGDEWHFIVIPDDFARSVGKYVPPEGPFPVSETLTRVETRVSLPMGTSFVLDRTEGRDGKAYRTSLLLGLVPWWVIASKGAACDAPCLTYDADRGVSMIVGVEIL